MTKAALTLIVATFALAACETVEGFGRDVQTAGSAVETEAEQAK